MARSAHDGTPQHLNKLLPDCFKLHSGSSFLVLRKQETQTIHVSANCFPEKRDHRPSYKNKCFIRRCVGLCGASTARGEDGVGSLRLLMCPVTPAQAHMSDTHTHTHTPLPEASALCVILPRMPAWPPPWPPSACFLHGFLLECPLEDCSLPEFPASTSTSPNTIVYMTSYVFRSLISYALYSVE